MSRRRSPRTNLPLERGAFVGRRRQLDEVGALIAAGHRLISLVGPEGMGKTRLALHAATLELPRFGERGGVWFIEATGARDPGAIVRAILDVQGAYAEPGASVEDEARRAFEGLAARGPALAVLDGLATPLSPQLFSAAAAAAPTLQLVVTARAPLAAPGERVVSVGPLRTPKSNERGPGRAMETESVRLFLERAGEARRGYAPSEAEVRAIIEIVKHLEGIPLAIEIAAARLRGLTAAELLEHLPRNVHRLAGQPGTGAATRAGRALEGAVAWSVDLLSTWELDALVQAAVFRGGFDSAAAEAIIDLSAHVEAPPVAGALAALVERALLRILPDARHSKTDTHGPDHHRYDMSDAVRAFVNERADTGAPGSPLALRHASHFVKQCGAWAEHVDGHGGLALRRAIATESENLLAAVQRSYTAEPQTLESVTSGLQGTLALEPVLLTRGPHALFIELLDVGLVRAGSNDAPHGLRARAFEARARAHRARHALRESLDDLEHALLEAQQARDPILEARARANIGTHHLMVADWARAALEYDAALRLFDELGERRLYARAVGFKALLLHERGDIAACIEHYHQALKLHRELGDRRWEAIHLAQLAAARLEQGDARSAREGLDDALETHRELANRRMEGIALTTLGDVELTDGDLDSARAHWGRARALLEQLGDPAAEARAASRLAALAARERLPGAAALATRARALAARLGSPALDDVVAILASGVAPPSAQPGEAARAAARVARMIEQGARAR